jgi:hypothetical protein
LELADNEQSGSKADTAISYPGTGGR